MPSWLTIRCIDVTTKSHHLSNYTKRQIQLDTIFGYFLDTAAYGMGELAEVLVGVARTAVLVKRISTLHGGGVRINFRQMRLEKAKSKSNEQRINSGAQIDFEIWTAPFGQRHLLEKWPFRVDLGARGSRIT